MTKQLSFLLISAVFGLISCSESHTHQDFINKTASQANSLATSNKKHELWSFIRGAWEGRCYAQQADGREIVTFGDDARIEFRSVSEEAEFDASEHGLYEIVGEEKIKLYYLAAGDFVTVKKINYDKIEFEGLDAPIYAGCEFSRLMETDE